MPSTYQSTVINAPIEKVWTTIRNFHDLSWAPEVVQSCEVIGEARGDQIGSKRLLNGVFHETLLELSDHNFSFRYQITDGPSPVSKDEVSDYFGTVQLKRITDSDHTFIEWFSDWEASSKAAEGFCHGIYVALLDSLKKACV